VHGEALPASEKDPVDWDDANKFMMMLKDAGLNPQKSAPTAGSGIRFQSRLRVGIRHLRMPKLVLTFKELREPKKLGCQNEREIKRLK